MLFDPTGTKCVENKKKSFICGWFFTRNEIVNVHENRFSLLTKKLFYEPHVDSKKKAGEKRAKERGGVENETLSRDSFLSLRIFSVQRRKHVHAAFLKNQHSVIVQRFFRSV